MTIREALTRCDALQHNTFSQAQKLQWLSELEGLVHQLILQNREGEPERTFPGFDEHTDPATPLAAEEPFAEMYLYFLQSRIHYHNGEPERCNNANAMFRQVWEEYANYVNRKTPHRRRCFRYF